MPHEELENSKKDLSEGHKISTKSLRKGKVLLINPPQTFFPGSKQIQIGLPLGIMYIAAVLEKENYKVEILDTLITNFQAGKKGGTKQYGMPWEKIKEEIENRRPDIIGITCPFSTQVNNAIKVAEIAKTIDSRILTIVGGPHSSAMASQLLEVAKDVDIAVIGEGELTMLDIMKYYEGTKEISEIQGIAYRNKGSIVLNPLRTFIENLDELPLPAYHLVDMEAYLNPKVRYRGTKGLRAIPMVTSRGCPYNCVFCSIHLHMGNVCRIHSAEYTIKHIKHVIDNYSIKRIHFEDDNLTLDLKRFNTILDGIIEKGIKFTWDVPNGVRADKLTFSLLTKMKETGCVQLSIGIESGDQSILDTIINKHLCLDDVIKTAEMCSDLDIPLIGFYVIGFPGEKIENIKRTIDFALELKRKFNVYIHLSIAIPLYGTKLYKICSEKGYFYRELTPSTLLEGSDFYGTGLIITEDFTPGQIKKLGLETLKIYKKLLLLGYLKNPLTTLRKGLNNWDGTIRFIKSLFS